MQIRKTWFSYLALFLFLFGILYILICGIAAAGEGQEYPFLVKGMLMLILAGTLVGSHFAAVVGARMELESWAERSPIVWKAVEAAMVCLILAGSFALRIWVTKAMPMTPQSDYKTYYEIAQMLNQGTLLEEGKGYCDYVAIFPHVLGYSAVLAALFRIFGESVFVGQMFNITLAVATCLICWHITRMLTGRIAAMFALFIIAFWPSMILYNNFLAAEYLFSFLLFLCVWLMVILVTRFTPDSPEQWRGILLHALLGILLACTSAIRPMALLLLISICICLAPSRMNGPILPRNDIPVANRFMQRGWVRALVVLLCYLAVSAFINKCVAFTVDRELASGSASMGYNLLVGLNEEAYGGWNPEDAAYLYDVLDSTGSAEQAQIACRDLALQRLGGGFRMLSNLFMRKYTVLWGNDDYGITWNIILLDEMGTLTQELENILYSLQDFNNIWYLVVVFFAGLGGIYLIKSRGSWSYMLVLLFCGTVAMHLLVENQNRYHFHCLYVFAILAAQGLHLMYQDSKYRVVIGNANRKRMEQEKEEEKVALKRINEAEALAQATQDKAMGVLFDMEQALKTGHVQVSVSQAYSARSKEFLEQIGVEGLDVTAEEDPAEAVHEAVEAAKAEPVKAAEEAAESAETAETSETAAVSETEEITEAAAVTEAETVNEAAAVTETVAEVAVASEAEAITEAAVSEAETITEAVVASEPEAFIEAAVSETDTEEATAIESEGTSETVQISETEGAPKAAPVIIPAASAGNEEQAVAKMPELSAETSGEPEAEKLAARLDNIQDKTKSADVVPNLSIIDFSKKAVPAQPQLTLLDLPKPPAADVPKIPQKKIPKKTVLGKPDVPEKASQPVADVPKKPSAVLQQFQVIDTPKKPVMDIPSLPRLDIPKAAVIDIPKIPVFATKKKSVVAVPKKKELNIDMQRVWILDAPRKPVLDIPAAPKLDIPKAAVIDIPKMPVFAAQKKPAAVVPKKKESTAPSQELPRRVQKVTVMIPRGKTSAAPQKSVLTIHPMPKRKES